MYSLMSMRIINFSWSKRNSARARASSVFPTPVGPRKMKEPMGRLGSESPARLRRTALATRARASSWPTTRSEEHTSELQSRLHLVCRLLLEQKDQDESPYTTNCISGV